MPFIVPNATDTTGGNKYAALDQAEPDSLHFEILANRSSGVVSGCAVTSAGTSTSVNVAAGIVVLNGASYVVNASSGFGLPAAPTDKRFDIIVARVSGGVATLTAVSGDDNATNPSFPKSTSVILTAPSPTTNVNLTTDVPLAAVYRTGSSSITDSRITDLRASITTAITDQGASVPATSYGSGTGALFLKTGTPSGTASGVYVKTSSGAWIELAQNVGPHLPIGAVAGWPATGSLPAGYVEANGQSLSTSSYPALFGIYGYTHGGSGGSFNVPNYNNKYLRGTTTTGQVPVLIGSDTVSLGAANLPSHTHGMSHIHAMGHQHLMDHTHTATTDPQGAHQHSIAHNHATFTTTAGGSHSHASTEAAFAMESLILQADKLWLNLSASNTQPSASDAWYESGNATATSTHTHSIDVPAYTGNSDTAAAHTHNVTVAALSSTYTGLPNVGSTDYSSISSTDGGSGLTGTSFSVIPASAQIRWIICATLGTDASFVGGVNGSYKAAQTVTAQTASYTALTTDIGNLVTITAAGATNLTINTSLGMVAGQRMDIVQGGAGIVTVVASGVTITSVAGLRTKGAGSLATLICTGTNTYILTGDTQV